MKIELYKAEKLSQKGSSLRSMIMNNGMPILDLLVRESIQNSLDAKDDTNKAKSVQVDFTIDSFDVKTLNSELDGIHLEKKPFLGNRFLAIRDTNTVGLTGQYDDKKSNLYKLVYGIMEAQSASGAGGSWGIGKTIYFRVGIGLVLYYSRIKNADGSYESLLAADLVEDETASGALLPAVGGDRYGIAWWGDKVRGSSGGVRETRKSGTINKILDAFNIEPFRGSSTGTVIIIPFIDENTLLSNNQPKLEDGQTPAFWTKNIRDYLAISVQKWYSSRLGNKKYIHGKYLDVTINGKGISPSDMEPFFRLSQALYNKAALTIAKSKDADKVKFSDVDILCEKIKVNSEIDPPEAGYVAFAKVTRRQIGMTAPSNCPSPYEYIHGCADADEFGKPIVIFSRKPGMAVSYETDGKWTAFIPTTADDEYIIAYFVVNSGTMLAPSLASISLEDYVRKSEYADHTSWDDCDLGNGNRPTIISKIKKNVSKKVGKAFEGENDAPEESERSGLGTLLGRLLLPPEGFGKKPSTPPGGGGGGSSAVHKNVRYTYSVEQYTASGLILSVRISTGKKKSATFGAELMMDSVTGPISSSVWESEMGLNMPFFFNDAQLTVGKIDGAKSGTVIKITKDGMQGAGAITGSNIMTKGRDWSAMSFAFADKEVHSFEMTLRIDITVRRRDIKPVMTFEF